MESIHVWDGDITGYRPSLNCAAELIASWAGPDCAEKIFRERACRGRRDGGRSALQSHHFFDIGVVTARAQDDLYVGLAPIAPIPAVITSKRRGQLACIG